jgi:N-acetylglucosamine-6-sulfatase
VRVTKRVWAGLAAIAVLAAGCTGSGQGPGASSGGPSGTPPGPSSSFPAGSGSTRPNVLILLSDDQASRLFTRDLMPNVFSRVVDGGVNFTRAYVNVSQCCPSRSSILTGLSAHNSGVDSNTVTLDGQNPVRPVFPLAMQSAGYRTGLFGKYLNSEPCRPRPGWDVWVCATGGTEVDPPLNENGRNSQAKGYTVDILARKAVSFIDDPGSGRPFFVYYAPKSPHLPADDNRDKRPVLPNSPPSFNANPNPLSRPAWTRLPPLPADKVRTIQNWNAKMTRQIPPLDTAIGTILDAADRRGADTLVIFMSDNGFMYGEHRLTSKNQPYEESVRVPLAIRYPPALEPGNHFESAALVSNVDLAATVMDAASIPFESDGASLLPIVSRSADRVHDAVLIEWCQAGNRDPCQAAGRAEELNRFELPPYWGIETERYVYVEYATGEAELYDLSTDPYEMTNLAGVAWQRLLRQDLATQLAALRAPPDAPGTTIVTGPRGNVSGASGVGFVFFSQARTTTFRCRLQGPSPKAKSLPCDSGRIDYQSLARGDYVFTVKAVDARGHADPTPASRRFSITA